MALSNNHVAEIQGLYGPFTMAERVVQKIWFQRDFDETSAVLTDGRKMAVRSVGIWNRLGGPDFRDARLVFDGVEITGDVEVHFHAADWRAHGHEADPAYNNVALHVVLFPPGVEEKPAFRGEGGLIPTLVLLPLLHRDLEEYTSDDALEIITARDEWRRVAELTGRPQAELRALLIAKALEAWRRKVCFAGLRLEKLGWRAAAHHAALEILGYRRNRVVMLAVAAKYPLEAWSDKIEPAAVFAENSARWQLQGVRPANHPLRRLRQYHQGVVACPDWPDHVVPFLMGLPVNLSAAMPTRTARRLLHLGERRKKMSRGLLRDAVGGTRLDNLICDGLLPLVAASEKMDLFALWFHWFLGDIPDHVRKTLPKLGLNDGQMQPICCGYARGLLSWFLECDARASG